VTAAKRPARPWLAGLAVAIGLTMSPAAPLWAAAPGDGDASGWREESTARSTSGKSTLRWRVTRKSAEPAVPSRGGEPRLVDADQPRANSAADNGEEPDSIGRIRVETDGNVFRAVFLRPVGQRRDASVEETAGPGNPVLRSALQPVAEDDEPEAGAVIESDDEPLSQPRYRDREQPTAPADDLPDPTATEEEPPMPPGRLPRGGAAPAAPLDDFTDDWEQRIEDCEDDCPDVHDPRLFRSLDKISLDIRDPLPTRCVSYDPNSHRETVEDEWTWEEFLKCLSTRPADDKARCWQLPKGGRVTATFERYADGTLYLQSTEGERLTLAWDQVVLTDRRYLMDLPLECPLGDERFLPRMWCATTYTWKASALCHKPLYFEQVQMERYGHTLGPLLDPIISGAHFFGTLPILPYKMGIEPPTECIYPLGYYRPNSCAPYMIPPIPLSLRGAILQGAAVTGAIYAFP
jgi:hypothetical protein